MQVLGSTDQATKAAMFKGISSKMEAGCGVSLCSITFLWLGKFLLGGMTQLTTAYPQSPIVENYRPPGDFMAYWYRRLFFPAGVPAGYRAKEGTVRLMGNWTASEPINGRVGLLAQNADSGGGDWPVARMQKVLHNLRHHLLLFPGSAPSPADCKGLQDMAVHMVENYPSLVQSLWLVPQSEVKQISVNKQGSSSIALSTLDDGQTKGLDSSTSAAQEGKMIVLGDDTGAVYKRYSGAVYKCYLVRPDGYVAFRSPVSDPAPLLSYLSRIFKVPS